MDEMLIHLYFRNFAENSEWISPCLYIESFFLDGLIGNVSISESVLFIGNKNWPIPNINKIQQCDLGRSELFLH